MTDKDKFHSDMEDHVDKGFKVVVNYSAIALGGLGGHWELWIKS